MKKIFIPLFLTAVCLMTGCNTGSTDPIRENTSISGFESVDGGFTTKINNSEETFSFINKVKVPTNCSWNLYYDFEAKNEIVSKTIRCDLGNNRIYLLVANPKETIGFYNVDVYRYHLYDVVFDTNGGTYIPSQQVQEESLIEPVSDPIKTGYTFVSWNYNFEQPVTSDLRISASYTTNAYNVTLNPNGGKLKGKSSFEIAFGEEYTLETPSYTGKDFLGWYLDENLVSSSGKWNIDNDCTLQAKWKTSTYTITYNPNGGCIDGANTQTVDYGSSFILKSPMRKGYTFLGWYNNDVKVESGTWYFEENLVLVAKWSANAYTIYFDYNGGFASEEFMNVIFDSSVVLPTTNKNGYTFLGWYYGDILVENGKWTIDDNITLVAHWQANVYLAELSTFSSIYRQNDFDNYVVRYHENGGKITTKTYKYGDEISVYTPDSSSNSYFDGWFLDSAFTIPFTFEKGFESKETDLYGKYVSESSTLTVNTDPQIFSFTSSYTSTRYFNVPISGSYLFNVNFDLKKFSSTSGSFYLYLWIQNRDTASVYASESVSFYKETISFSKTINLKAGDRILVKEAHNDGYVTTKSTWSIGISSCDKLSCSYNQKEFATSFTFDENYNLGIPTDIPVGLSFVGWFTGYNGEGTKVTDSNGQSLAKWNFLSDQVFYPFFK